MDAIEIKPRIRFTYEDYKNLPESETKRYELLDGELVMVPAPTIGHQRISRNILVMLWDYLQEHPIGEILDAPCDVRLGEDVVQPDIIYIANERRSIIKEELVDGAPDIVVEVFSPATVGRDKTYKRTLYARQGVREYWLVDPDERTIEVLRLTEAGFEHLATYHEADTLTSHLLPGLEMSLAEVFTEAK
jgi:Uma2 family endonuclease